MSHDGKTSSETTLFVEYVAASRCISDLTDATKTSLERNQALTQLRAIYDKYLECPTLLDPYLEEMVTSLSQSARLQLELSTEPEHTLLPHILSALYSLSKVRGYKRVQRFLPHEARDVEPVFHTLQRIEAAAASSSSSTCESGPQQWESIYVLWIWLGILSLVPFDCAVLSDDTLIPSLVALAKSHLSHAGPVRETASSCLASWLSRPDLQPDLTAFVEWSHSVLITEPHKNVFVVMGVVQTLATVVKISTNRFNLDMEQLWEPALMVAESSATSRAMILRKLLVKWFSRMGCAYLPPRVAPWRYQRGRRSLLENVTAPSPTTQQQTINPKSKTDALLNHDNDLFTVPDHVEDAMGLILQSLSDSSTVVRWSAAKGVGRMTERLPSICADDVLDAILMLCRDEEKDHAWHGACLALAELARRGLLLPNRLQDVVPVVVRAIQFDVRRGQSSVGANVRDAACYTYWAFARAYAPSVLKPYILELSRSLVLACLFDREINCRRAASAAFQECVGRQGADNFKHGISILTAADYFSLGNLTNAYTSVTYHVAQFPEYRQSIIAHVFETKLHHWDPNIRHLASKSLHGLTPFDPALMRDSVIPFLIENCTDENLFTRHGAVLGVAEIILALGNVSSNDKGSTLDDFDQDLRTSIAELVPKIEKARLYRGRGGEIMRSAVCRLIECLSQARLPLTVKQQVRLLDSVDACMKHPTEDIQDAASKALHALMRTYFPVSGKGPSMRLQSRVVDNYVNIVNTSINPAETRGFVLALGALPRKLLAPTRAVLASVLDCLCHAARHDSKVGDEGDAETRRNAILSLSRVCAEVGIHKQGTLPSLDEQAHPSVKLDQKQAAQAFDALLLGLDDYNIDRRGDVGSWSRMAAMSGLESLTYSAIESSTFDPSNCHIDNPCQLSDIAPHYNPDKVNNPTPSEEHGAVSSQEIMYFSNGRCVRIVGGFLKQLSEKLDLVRAHAGACLERMLNRTSPVIQFVPMRDIVLKALDLDQENRVASQNWANAADTYRMVMAAANINVFFHYVISGIIISVGGLAESITKYSEAALLAWIRKGSTTEPSSRAELLGKELLDLFRTHQRDSRVILPLLKTLDILLARGCLNSLVHTDSSVFPLALLVRLKAETKNCTDVHRLLAITSVSLGILTSEQSLQVNETILVFVFRLLGHRFPRVRRFTADQVYVRLLEEPEVIPIQDNAELVLEMLLESQWDADMETSEVRELTNRFADQMGVAMPIDNSGDSSPTRKREIIADEFESYASLINSIE